MGDTAFLKKYGDNSSLNEVLIDIAKKHGLFAAIKVMTDEKVPVFIERGEYLIFGGDEKRVKKLASDYSTGVFLPNEILRQIDVTDIFPRCTVVKIMPSFCKMAGLLEKFLEDELVIHLFNKYEQPLPTILSRRDFQILYNAYQHSSEGELKKLLEIVSGGKSLEGHEQEKKTGWLGNLFAKKEVTYTPISMNCVPKEHIIELPYSKSKMDVLHGEKGAIIRKIDEELGKYPHMKWSLKETATMTADATGERQYRHRLTYPTKYETTLASIVHRIELGLDAGQKGRTLCKSYIKGAKEDVFATAIPYKLFRKFAMAAAEVGLEYYYDEDSVYIAQKPEEIGICVEGEVELILLADMEGEMLRELASGSYVKEV